MSRSCSGPNPASRPRRRPRFRPGFAPEALGAGAFATGALAAGCFGAGPRLAAAWARPCLDAGLAAAGEVFVRRLDLVIDTGLGGRRVIPLTAPKVHL